jgi:putative ABC transport system substrate-binding protein
MPVAANDREAQPRVSAFQRRLQELGWTDGHNLRIDYRWTPEDTDRMRAQAAELVSLKPDAIVAGGSPAVVALRAETRTIPILFMQVIDPVAVGFVTSLSRPGGNLTGITNFEFAMGSKWLEILKEISPQLARVAVLYNPRTARYAGMLSSVTAAAPSFAIELTDSPFQDAAVIERAIAKVKWRAACVAGREHPASSRPDHWAHSPTPVAGRLSISLFRRQRRLGFVWSRCD